MTMKILKLIERTKADQSTTINVNYTKVCSDARIEKRYALKRASSPKRFNDFIMPCKQWLQRKSLTERRIMEERGSTLRATPA